MTGSRTPPVAAPTEEQDSDYEPAVLAAVQALLVTLAKTFRAYQLYDENNPVRRRFGDQLRNELTALWSHVEQLVLRIDEDHMYLGEVAIYHSESRNDSLAFLFFKDGIREIKLLPGLETEELDRFLGVLQQARKLVPEGDDLLTVLWEADLRYFEYQPVGTLVILDTHELAIVAQVNKDPALLHRPIVRVISDPVGLPLPQPKTLDLAESDPATGAARHQIIKTTDPQKYGIRVSDYLIAT